MLITDREQLKAFSASERIWQGIASMERTEGGRLFSAFYSGNVKETFGNFVVLLTSDDDGETWTDPAAVAYAGEHARCYDSALWIDPRGRLWWTWSVFPVASVWASVCEDPDAKTLTWSAPRLIGGEVMMNKPIALSDGRWIFPMATWRDGVRDKDTPPTFDHPGRSYVWETADEGRTFACIGGSEVPERHFDEHMVLEKKDGSLLMLVRTLYGIGKSMSYDGGRTWTPGEDSGIPGPDSRFFLGRLKSGNVLLVNNIPDPSRKGFREKLCAWISRDDCETWEGPLMLDERAEVSYPDASERGGEIWITYDRERGGFKSSLEEALKDAREILMCRITEADILAGKLVSPNSKLKITVSRLGKYEKDASELYAREQWYI